VSFMLIEYRVFEDFVSRLKNRKVEFLAYFIVMALGVELWLYHIFMSIPRVEGYPGLSIVYYLDFNRLQMAFLMLISLISFPLSLLLSRVGFILNPDGVSWLHRFIVDLMVVPLCLFSQFYFLWSFLSWILNAFPKPRGWLVPVVVFVGGLMTMLSLTLFSWTSTWKPFWRSWVYGGLKRLIVIFIISTAIFSVFIFAVIGVFSCEYHLADRLDLRELYLENPLLADEVKRGIMLYTSSTFVLFAFVIISAFVMLFQILYSCFDAG